MSDFLVLENITKRFPGLLANDNISLKIKKGHVHALLGENGAGKSTLMKILYGAYQADSGKILVDGKQVQIHSPRDAQQVGIGMVFQRFMLIPNFTVIENVALSLRELGITIPTAKIEAQIKAISKQYGFEVEPGAKVWQLSLGVQQKVEIIKLLLAEARLLIFDEPTSVLAPHEVEGLFQVFDRLRESGHTIIFISHKLREVLKCSDEITVLRKGRVGGHLLREEATEQKLVSLILGTQVADEKNQYERKAMPDEKKPVLELQSVEAEDERGQRVLREVSLKLHAGEILGVAGVSGNGQKELGEVILGMLPLKAGNISLEGQDLKHWTIARRLQAGIACVPEDPIQMGAVGGLTVQENLALGAAFSKDTKGWQAINWKAASARADWFTERFELKMPRFGVAIEALSGGNVQRVVFARELSSKPKVILAYYPSRGLDIGATETIRKALLACRDEGAAILLVSEDLEELFALSDRIMVMYHGQNAGECRPEDGIEGSQVGFLMTDGKRPEKVLH
jgi:simple sugar transport system ATP-binding protein